MNNTTRLVLLVIFIILCFSFVWILSNKEDRLWLLKGFIPAFITYIILSIAKYCL